jgi:hypothetical protein
VLLPLPSAAFVDRLRPPFDDGDLLVGESVEFVDQFVEEAV